MASREAPRSLARVTDPERRRTRSWAAWRRSSRAQVSRPSRRTSAWPRATATRPRPASSTPSSWLSHAISPRASPGDAFSDTTAWASRADPCHVTSEGRGAKTTRWVRSSTGTASRRSGSESAETSAAAEAVATPSGVVLCKGCSSWGTAAHASSSGFAGAKIPAIRIST